MDTNLTTLDNGLKVITVPMADNPTATVLVMVEAGTKYEDKSKNGISHFLEHMCFKGTDNRPTSFDISSELDGLGAESNAFTWYEYTGYYAKARARHTDQLLDVVSDIYLNPLFPEAELEKEKGVIIEEMNMCNDLPARRVNERFYELLYGEQPAGWPVLGQEEVIRNMTQADFKDYYTKHYLPEATTVVIAGGIDESSILEQVKTAFGSAQPGEKQGKSAVKEAQSEPRALLESRETDQTHLVLGMRAYPWGDDRAYAAGTLSTILGGGMSSRLFQKLREEMGVCYYVWSKNEAFTDTGILRISTGVDKNRVEEVVKGLINELEKIRDEGLTEGELGRAKEYLVGNKLMGLERSNEQALYYGEQSIMHVPLETPEEESEHFKAITEEDIQAVCGDLIRADNLNLATVGSYEEEETALDILGDV